MSVLSLSPEALCEANKRVVNLSVETDEAGPAPKRAPTRVYAEDRLECMLPSTG